MNCKENELAIVVHSASGNEDKIVRCIRLAFDTDIPYGLYKKDGCPIWVIDRSLPMTGGRMSNLFLDERLRPIRPDAEPVDVDVVAEVGA